MWGEFGENLRLSKEEIKLGFMFVKKLIEKRGNDLEKIGRRNLSSLLFLI